MNDLTATLIELIDVPSETGSEGRIATYVAAHFLPVWGRLGVDRIGNSVVVGDRSAPPTILLVGHLDTVPSQGQGPAFIADGRIHGLGASDMKAGIAVMMHLLNDDAVRAGPYPIAGVFYDREEGRADDNGLETVLERAPWLTEAEFAVVLEPTDMELQLGCVGSINAALRFTGTAAHAARPWNGENAITKAGEWLTKMHHRQPVAVHVAGLEFREVATVTMASGGVARNIVPAVVEFNVNYRFAPDKTLDEAEALLREIAVDADQMEIVDRAPAAPISEDSPFLQHLIDVCGGPVRPKQAWTDVARLAGRGVPAVNYGPGETLQAHQTDESAPEENLQRVFQTLKRFLIES
jgi:succinyl-diaminopimelate desuccinylase